MILFNKKKIEEKIRGSVLREAEEFYNRKLQIERHRIIDAALGKLQNFTEKSFISVKVKVDNSNTIKEIIGEMEHTVANSMIGNVRKELLKLI